MLPLLLLPPLLLSKPLFQFSETAGLRTKGGLCHCLHSNALLDKTKLYVLLCPDLIIRTTCLCHFVQVFPAATVLSQLLIPDSVPITTALSRFSKSTSYIHLQQAHCIQPIEQSYMTGWCTAAQSMRWYLWIIAFWDSFQNGKKLPRIREKNYWWTQ